MLQWKLKIIGLDLEVDPHPNNYPIKSGKNCPIKSDFTLGSAVRNGTCYTSSECNSKGGTASGNCAAG
jgi:hypothetical protein